MLKFFQTRLAVATGASVAVVALMAVSVGTVHAVATQDQEETEEASQGERELRRAKSLEHRALLEARLGEAKQALHEARERGSHERLRLVQELRQRSRAPMVELRTSRGRFRGGVADRVLAMAEEIELTEQQEAQIRDARRDQRRAQIERDAQIEILDLDLDEMLEDRHSANLDAVEELMQRRAGLRVQGQVADMRVSQDVWNSLSAEQQEKLESNRHGIYMMRGNSPHSLFLDGEGNEFAFRSDDFEFGEMEFGELFNDFHLEGLDGLLELKFGDDTPGVWEFKLKSDEEGIHEEGIHEEGAKKDSTDGTAVGVSRSGGSIG